MNNTGWVKLWRSLFHNGLSEDKPWCDGYAWCYLFAMANHEKGFVNFSNEYIEIERGQFLTSQIKLAAKWGWTRKHVKTFLNALKNDENIAIRTTNRYIVITIINYDNYQSYAENNDQQNDQQQIQQKRNRRSTGAHKQEVKNDKKSIKALYGQHVLLTESEHAKLIDKFGEAGTIKWIERLDRYAEQKARKFKEYTSHYATILAWHDKDVTTTPRIKQLDVFQNAPVEKYGITVDGKEVPPRED